MLPRTSRGRRRRVKRSFWDPSHALYGLFDVWSFSGLAAVVASGLGGGSLIYANVLERVPDGWMRYEHPDDGSRRLWPIDAAALAPHYRAVETKLAPTPYPTRSRSDRRPRRVHSGPPPSKWASRRAAEARRAVRG